MTNDTNHPTNPPCSCRSCTSRCEHISGVMTPQEAIEAIAAGYADRLMTVPYWETDNTPTYHLQPLTVCPDGTSPHTRRDSRDAMGRCTFLTVAGLCEVHNTPFKPTECREAYGDGCVHKPLDKSRELRGRDAGIWTTSFAASVRAIWRACKS